VGAEQVARAAGWAVEEVDSVAADKEAGSFNGASGKAVGRAKILSRFMYQ